MFRTLPCYDFWVLFTKEAQGFQNCFSWFSRQVHQSKRLYKIMATYFWLFLWIQRDSVPHGLYVLLFSYITVRVSCCFPWFFLRTSFLGYSSPRNKYHREVLCGKGRAFCSTYSRFAIFKANHMTQWQTQCIQTFFMKCCIFLRTFWNLT